MISAGESDAGLKAYEQTLAFAALRRKKLPWVYGLFPVLLLLLGAAVVTKGFRLAGEACFITAVLFAIYSAWNWSRLRKLDAANRVLLARLEAQYGDDLPWLEVERQMRQMRQIQRIEAEEHLPTTDDPLRPPLRVAPDERGER